MSDQGTIESTSDFRVPSIYPRCRRARCHQAPVADMKRRPHPNTGRDQWWAYCADHLAEYGREVRDGRVWWVPGLSLYDRQASP
jgi:hypothetical protein